MAGRRRKPGAVRCGGCGARATWDSEDALYQCGRWDMDAQEYVGGCGWWCSERDAPPPDDGRIRGPEDVAPRVAGARARRESDARLAGREVALALHELYCETAERHAWVEVMAADSWAEAELTRRLGRRVHRTQVRRSRLALEGLGYVRRVREPRGFPLVERVAAYKLEGRTPPVIVEVLKAKEEA